MKEFRNQLYDFISLIDKYEYDNFKQTTTTGKYEIDSEKHSGMSMKLQESTFDDDSPINAIKGKLAVG